MFKPNRLIWKEKASSGADKKHGGLTNLSIIKEMAAHSNWSRMLGRTGKKILDGTNRIGTGAIDVVGRSTLDVIQHLSVTVRGAIANTLAPVLALDSDKTFGAKLVDSLKEIPLSVVGRNIGNIGYGVAGIASSVTGIGLDTEAKDKKFFDKIKLKRGIGLSGIAWKLIGGASDILGSPYGADIVGASEESEQDNAELGKGWRADMITPFYRAGASDNKDKKKPASAKPKAPKKEETAEEKH